MCQKLSSLSIELGQLLMSQLRHLTGQDFAETHCPERQIKACKDQVKA